VKAGSGGGKGNFYTPGLKMLHPDFNLKLFEPVATLSGAEAILVHPFGWSR
jgi:hypothetical protein